MSDIENRYEEMRRLAEICKQLREAPGQGADDLYSAAQNRMGEIAKGISNRQWSSEFKFEATCDNWYARELTLTGLLHLLVCEQKKWNDNHWPLPHFCVYHNGERVAQVSGSSE